MHAKSILKQSGNRWNSTTQADNSTTDRINSTTQADNSTMNANNSTVSLKRGCLISP